MEVGNFALDLCRRGPEDVTVPGTFFGLELKEAAHGFYLAADISVAASSPTADTAEGPGEEEVGGCFMDLNGEVEACCFGLRDEVKVDGTSTEEGVADFVLHLPSLVAGEDVLCLEEPLRSGRMTEAEAKISSMPGKVQGELGKIACVDPEPASWAVDGPVKELTSIADAEGSMIWVVAKRTSGRTFDQGLGHG